MPIVPDYIYFFQVPVVAVQDENAFAKKNAKTFGVQAQPSQFSVFVDEPPKPVLKESRVSSLSSALPETLTALPSSRLPLSDVPCSPEQVISIDDSTGRI